MRRSFLYMLVLAAVLVCPTKGTDVGELQPVQTVAVYQNEDGYTVLTDTKDVGRGEDIPAAIENLKATTPATIYLDTAQYLIAGDESLVEGLRPYLKKSVKLCLFVGEPPMETVSKFLSAHPMSETLGDWEEGTTLPVLDCTKDRLKFFGK